MGAGGYVAVHIRLGDFSEVADDALANSDHPSPYFRIPLSWYANQVRALRRRFRDIRIYVFSDGERRWLAPILDLGAEL